MAVDPAPGRRAALALVAVAIGLGLAVGEAALRALDFSYYWAVARQPDPRTGWTLAPGVDAWQDIEGRARVRINAAGLRDRDRTLARPPGVLRVAVLGDSFTEAVQVPMEDAFPAVLERELGQCRALAGRPGPVEVLNFGVSGYSTAQALLAFRARVRAYRPDVVVLAFFPGNDLVEGSRALDDEALRPYFTLRDGGLVEDASFLDGAEYRWRASAGGRALAWLVERSRLLQAGFKARDVVRLRLGADGEPAAWDEPGVDERVYREPEDAVWTEAWAVTEALIAALAREARETGADFLLATASTGAQVHPDPGFRAAFMQAHGISDLLYPERRLQALGNREGFPVVGLARELQGLAELSGAWLHGFANSMPGIGHWNRTGHRLAGELLANTLCAGGER